MVTATPFCEELEYTVSFRQVRRVDREDAPPSGRFETTGRAKLARESRYRRGSSCSKQGIQHRGKVKARI